jgi:hypothetical protein
MICKIKTIFSKFGPPPFSSAIDTIFLHVQNGNILNEFLSSKEK